MPRQAPGYTYAATSSPSNGSGKASVSTTSGSTIAVPAYDRINLWLTNTGANAVSVGLGTTAVAGQGIVLPANQTVPFSIQGFTGAIYLICASGTSAVAFAEI